MLIRDLQLLLTVHALENVEGGRTAVRQVGHLLARIRCLYSNRSCDIHSHCLVCCIASSACKTSIPSSKNKVRIDPMPLIGCCTCGQVVWRYRSDVFNGRVAGTG